MSKGIVGFMARDIGFDRNSSGVKGFRFKTGEKNCTVKVTT